MGQTSGNTGNVDNIVPMTRIYLLLPGHVQNSYPTRMLQLFLSTGFKRDLFSQKTKTPPPQHPLSPTFPLSPTPPWTPPTTVGCSPTPPCLPSAEEDPTGARDHAPTVLTHFPGRPSQPVPQWRRGEPGRLVHEDI